MKPRNFPGKKLRRQIRARERGCKYPADHPVIADTRFRLGAEGMVRVLNELCRQAEPSRIMVRCMEHEDCRRCRALGEACFVASGAAARQAAELESRWVLLRGF